MPSGGCWRAPSWTPATPTSSSCASGDIPLLDFNTTFDFITQAPKSFLSTSWKGGRSWTRKSTSQIPKKHWKRGSAWFTLQRQHAETVVGDSYYYRKFQEMALPEGNEGRYLQTLLSAVAEVQLTDHTLMFAQWRRAAKAAPHPRTFQARDVTPGLLSRALGPQCREGAYKWRRCSLFAQRFAGEALQPLMGLLPLAMPATGGGEDAQGSGEGKGGGRGKGQGPGKGRNKAEAPLLCPEDEDLFAKALAIEPARGAPRVAFLFLVRGPSLAPVWEKFFHGQPRELFSIYIHASSGSKGDEKGLPEVFQGRRIPSKVGLRVTQGEALLMYIPE